MAHESASFQEGGIDPEQQRRNVLANIARLSRELNAINEQLRSPKLSKSQKRGLQSQATEKKREISSAEKLFDRREQQGW